MATPSSADWGRGDTGRAHRIQGGSTVPQTHRSPTGGDRRFRATPSIRYLTVAWRRDRQFTSQATHRWDPGGVAPRTPYGGPSGRYEPGGTIISEYAWDAWEPAPSVTVTVNAKVPVTLAVPESSPDDDLSLIPLGSAPWDTEKW
jgi:hypothetical protein